jgi:hypothetical protein
MTGPAMMPPEMIEPFAEANGLQGVRWVAITVHGTVVGFDNGTSRTVGTPVVECRRWPLKRKYR